MFAQFQNEIMQPSFWLSLMKIVWIDILLSGDNALVIAMACRGLNPSQRKIGMVCGAGGAVLVRIALTGVISSLMLFPFLKIVGGFALIYVAVKLLIPEESDETVSNSDKLWTAIRIVIMADIVMSIDNMIAVAAAANGSILLLSLALAISIPLIVLGAAVITQFLNRIPALIWAGGALLGWIAGEVIATDPAIPIHLDKTEVYSSAFAGSCVVLIIGYVWRHHAKASQIA